MAKLATEEFIEQERSNGNVFEYTNAIHKDLYSRSLKYEVLNIIDLEEPLVEDFHKVSCRSVDVKVGEDFFKALNSGTGELGLYSFSEIGNGYIKLKDVTPEGLPILKAV